MLPPVQRTIQVIELLLQNPEGITPQALLAGVDASRSTLFAILRSLKALGYVEQRQERGRYHPGVRLLSWRKSTASAPREIVAAFQHEAARTPLEETLALFQAAGGTALLMAQVESPRRVHSVYTAEQTYTPAESAAARLLLAADEHIRTQGYAQHKAEDSLEIALPVCSDGVHPEAALVMSAPRYRLPEASLAAALNHLRALAARISYRLGALAYAPFQEQPQPSIGPTRPLSPEERDAFLQEPWAARLVCLRPDGRPHIVPVWHAWDGQAFYLPAWQGSRWAAYLHTNPQLSLSVDEPWPPLRRVVAQGRALALDSPPAHIVQHISQRYLGQAEAPHQVSTIFRMQPDSLKGWRN